MDTKNLSLTFLGSLMIAAGTYFAVNSLGFVNQNLQLLAGLACFTWAIGNTAQYYQAAKLSAELQQHLESKITEIIRFGGADRSTKVEINHPYGFADIIVKRSWNILMMIFLIVLCS